MLFDFDGTLVPNLDLPGLRRDVLQMAVAAGAPRAELEALMIVEIVDAAAAWLSRQGADGSKFHAEAHEFIRATEVAAARGTTLFPTVRPLLTALRERGIATGIVTRNCREAVQIMFPDAEACCDGIRARDDVTFLKPDARHLTDCLDDLGCPAVASAIVGDGLSDMRVGAELEMTCIGVLTGSGDTEGLKAAGAALVVETLAELTP